MKEVTISVNSASFPSQFVSDSEKASMEFGLQVGQAIQYEWFRRGGGDCILKEKLIAGSIIHIKLSKTV